VVSSYGWQQEDTEAPPLVAPCQRGPQPVDHVVSRLGPDESELSVGHAHAEEEEVDRLGEGPTARQEDRPDLTASDQKGLSDLLSTPPSVHGVEKDDTPMTEDP
jgi:hypothetical protein